MTRTLIHRNVLPARHPDISPETALSYHTSLRSLELLLADAAVSKALLSPGQTKVAPNRKQQALCFWQWKGCIRRNYSFKTSFTVGNKLTFLLEVTGTCENFLWSICSWQKKNPQLLLANIFMKKPNNQNQLPQKTQGMKSECYSVSKKSLIVKKGVKWHWWSLTESHCPTAAQLTRWTHPQLKPLHVNKTFPQELLL